MASLDFDIQTDPSRGLIEFTLTGQWTAATVVAFRTALDTACKELMEKGHPAGSLLVLSNSQTHGVQSKEIMEALGVLARDLDVVARKTAVVVASTLHKMQVQRVSTGDRIRTFTSDEEATAWLLA